MSRGAYRQPGNNKRDAVQHDSRAIRAGGTASSGKVNSLSHQLETLTQAEQSTSDLPSQNQPITALDEVTNLPINPVSDTLENRIEDSSESLVDSTKEELEDVAPNEQEEITIKELAERLGLTRQAIQQRQKQGTLKNLGWELIKGTGTSRNNPGRYRRIKAETHPLTNNSASWNTKVSSFLEEVSHND